MNTDKPQFLFALMQEMTRNITNWYGPDNWDSVRFGAYPDSLKRSVVRKLNKIFSGRAVLVPMHNNHILNNLSRLEDSLGGLSWLYEALADEYSKSILVQVVAFRVMGPEKVKLPLNTSSYWSQRESARAFIKNGETIRLKFHDLQLRHLTLERIGYPIEAYLLPAGAVDMFVIKQYEYQKRTPVIRAQEGDYVIDGGGCWGDTALYFAHSVGSQGKVYTFEFVPENLEILHRNLELNPQLRERIELVQHALSDKSGEIVTYSANGPGTSLRSGREGSSQTSTLSIDDLVKNRKLPRVDFIKMDIEGAELDALRGSERTLRAFKPTLAISAYHRENDLINIPAYLTSLNLGYEFFLDHFTIHSEETVLFASSN